MKNEKDEKVLVAFDPVCGMTVNENTAVGQSRFEDETFYFCSIDCKLEFDLNPTEYAKAAVRK